jgi:hypothetical protein
MNNFRVVLYGLAVAAAVCVGESAASSRKDREGQEPVGWNANGGCQGLRVKHPLNDRIRSFPSSVVPSFRDRPASLPECLTAWFHSRIAVGLRFISPT